MNRSSLVQRGYLHLRTGAAEIEVCGELDPAESGCHFPFGSFAAERRCRQSRLTRASRQTRETADANRRTSCPGRKLDPTERRASRRSGGSALSSTNRSGCRLKLPSDPISFSVLNPF